MARTWQRRRWDWGASSPRVVLECAATDSPEIVADVIRRAGYEVAVCTGPEPGRPCDLLADGSCALVDEADVVVNLLDGDVGHEIGVQIASCRRPPAQVLQVGPPTRCRDEVEPATDDVLIGRRFTGAQLVDAIRTAMRRRATPPAMWSDGVS